MKVKINREIRNYTESMFFGLTMRQFVFSLLAIGVAVGLYFLLRPYVGTETVSWMCVLGAAPFAALGSKCMELDATERLRILHDFYRQGEEADFHFNARDMMKKGHDFRDYICPDGIEKHSDYLALGGTFCRVLF